MVVQSLRLSSFTLCRYEPLDPQAHPDDFRWLVADEGAAWLRRVAENPQPTVAVAQRLRQELSAPRTHLVLEQVELRRRAAAKFPLAGAMFFTPTALEQATDHWVAAYKAGRLDAGTRVADLCCGIGGDLLALAARGPVTGVDRDPVMAILAEANLRALASRGDAVVGDVRCADATEMDLGDFQAWHIDPDRRPHGRRTTRAEWHQPDAAAIQGMLQRLPDAAVKLAPAASMPEAWSQEAELEWIGRDRQCRQLVAWFGRFAERPGMCRATILFGSTAGLDLGRPLQSRTVLGTPASMLPVAPRIGRYVFDPDPAVLAARLTSTLAGSHGLAAVAAEIPYLTGDHPIADPALACFEVTDVLPLNRKRLRSLLQERGIGRLEIKKRGVPDDPEQLRRQLRLRGDEAAVLLVAPIDGAVTAIVARRMS